MRNSLIMRLWLRAFRHYRYDYLHKNNNEKIVVYSFLCGKVKELPSIFASKNVHYVMYTDANVEDDKGWEVRKISLDGRSVYDVNKDCKWHPFRFREEGYDYAIYIDGNVEFIKDPHFVVRLHKSRPSYGFSGYRHAHRKCIYEEAKILMEKGRGNRLKIEELMARYHSENFPSSFGLFEATIILTDLHNEQALCLENKIYEEYLLSGTFRDQLVVPYVLWKEGLKIDNICNLGRHKRHAGIFRWEKNYERNDSLYGNCQDTTF